MAHTISLLRLPKTAIKNVLMISDARELIIFSTLSEHSKRLVKSINQKAEYSSFSPEQGCRVSFHWDWFIEFGDLDQDGPCTLVIQSPLKNVTYLTVPKFGVRKWLEHFMLIFNHPMTDLDIESHDDWVYTLESLRKLLEGLTIDDFEIQQENPLEILRYFPVMKSLSLGNYTGVLSPEDLKLIRKVLLGNTTSINLSDAIPFDLDILLMTNSESIQSNGDLISDKDLNTFLKLWCKGSNPNLKHLSLFYESLNQREEFKNFNEGIVFKGIKHTKKTDPLGQNLYDIFRKCDGTMATVILRSFPSFSMCVES